MIRYKPLKETIEQTKTPSFKKWFGNSKVVKSGKPLVVYHGATKNIVKFDKSYLGKSTDTGMWGSGFYFSSDPKYASSYSRGKGVVMSLYLRIQKPFIIKSKSDVPEIDVPEDTMEDLMKSDENYSKLFTKFVKSKGHDGVIVQLDSNYTEYIVFEPNQIKSAIGNNGNFDYRSNNILEGIE